MFEVVLESTLDAFTDESQLAYRHGIADVAGVSVDAVVIESVSSASLVVVTRIEGLTTAAEATSTSPPTVASVARALQAASAATLATATGLGVAVAVQLHVPPSAPPAPPPGPPDDRADGDSGGGRGGWNGGGGGGGGSAPHATTTAVSAEQMPAAMIGAIVGGGIGAAIVCAIAAYCCGRHARSASVSIAPALVSHNNKNQSPPAGGGALRVVPGQQESTPTLARSIAGEGEAATRVENFVSNDDDDDEADYDADLLPRHSRPMP